MSNDEKPEYIVTSPGEAADAPHSPLDIQLAGGLTAVRVSSSSKLVSSRSISQSTRSQSLQSSSSSCSTVVAESSTSTAQSTSSVHKHIQQPMAHQQHKTVSTSNLAATVTATGSHFHTKVTKGKFQSFLQHPDEQSSHHGASFVTSHQKHHQFVRSSSAHSEGGNGGGTGSIDFDTSIRKPDQFTRSASTQIDSDQHAQQNQSHLLANSGSSKTGHHQDHHSTGNLHREVSSILISKSAETIESRSISSGVMRSQLTLSGGFLAPPNRKLTILSPIHAPPGLHEMLTRRHGRSPLSPRVGFGAADMDLFP